MLGDKAREIVAKQVEKKLLEKGMNLNNLTDEELSAVAVNFIGDAPPSHVPREKVIEILSEQDSILNWAKSLKENAKKVAAVTKSNPLAAEMVERFSVWLRESGYTATELTQMLDGSKDGVISQQEFIAAVQKITNLEPPQWVVEHLIKVMDVNGDGVLVVSEFNDFLASIGFETVQLTPPVVEEEIDDLEKELELISSPEPTAEVVTVPEPVEVQAPAAVEVAPTSAAPVMEVAAEEEALPTIDTANEKMIERLQASRLSSEAIDIIAQCTAQVSVVHVHRIERTLMVSDEYRGGYSIVGDLDGGPFEVAIMFAQSDNEFIQSLEKGKAVECRAKICNWSSGLRRASLQGSDARLV